VNPDFRKVALISASLGLLVSLFFALRPDDDDAAATTAAQTTAEQTTTEAPPAATTTEQTTTAPPEPQVVNLKIVVPADTAQTVEQLAVQRDRQVVLVVESELTDHVHLHGYDLMADVAPGAPATIRFTADAPGRFEIELEDRGLQIGELEVRP
jgi:glucose/arabinose dehydrogenase